MGFLVMMLCYSLGVAQKTDKPKDGEGINAFCKRNNITPEQFKEWNKGHENFLKFGHPYYIEDPRINSEMQNQIDSVEELDKKKDELGRDETIVSGDNSDASLTVSDDNSSKETETHKETKSHLWWLWLAIGIVAEAFICFIIWGIWLRKVAIRDGENGNLSVQRHDNTSEIGNLKNGIQKLTNENRKLKKRIEDLEKEKGELLEENIRLGEQLDKGFNKRVDERTSNNEQPAENKSINVLYADFINEGSFTHVSEIPNDDSNFELHLKNEKTAGFVIYKPALPRIVSNPAAFLQGCDKQVLGQTGEVEINAEGLAQNDTDGKWKVINKLNVIIK